MAIYKQYTFGNRRLPVMIPRQPFVYASDECIPVVDGDITAEDSIYLFRLYEQFFFNKYSADINDWSGAVDTTYKKLIGTQYCYKYERDRNYTFTNEISEANINNDETAQDVLLTNGQWIYNGKPLKILGSITKQYVNDVYKYRYDFVFSIWYYKSPNWAILGIYTNSIAYSDTVVNTINALTNQRNTGSFNYFMCSNGTTNTPGTCWVQDVSSPIYYRSLSAENSLKFGGSASQFPGVALNPDGTPAAGTDVSVQEIDSENPYSGGGTSTTGGGDGSFDKDSDPVDFTPLPTLSAIGSGFAGLFSPTLSQIRELANYLWNNELNWEQLVKLVANPIDLLISLTVVPVKPKTSTTADIKVGFISTGVSMHKCDEQYVKFNCGKLTVDRYYDSALDFAPFTKIYIYLPMTLSEMI